MKEPGGGTRAFVLILGLTLVACEGARDSRAGYLRSIRQPPTLEPLPIAATLEFDGSFRPSGAAGGADCAITLVGRTWGTLVRVGPDGSVHDTVGHIGSNSEVASLEGNAGSVAAWAHYPGLPASVDSTLTVHRIPLPRHEWGGHLAGPAVPLGEGRYALAALSGRHMPRASPREWQATPLIHVLDSAGLVIGKLGRVENEGGRFKSWLAARAVLGVAGDTIYALRLSNAVLESWSATSGREIDRLELPRYFESAPVQEEVIRQPWITVRGEQPVFVEAPHVQTAAFGGDRIYAIRNYSVVRESVDHPGLEVDTRLVVTEEGLEVYSLQGALLGAYALPTPTPTWIRADTTGRIFLGAGRRLLVAQDPTRGPTPCTGMPELVRVRVEDRPFRSDLPVTTRSRSGG